MARQLATIEQLNTVADHSNADALEIASVRGWQVVVKLGEFRAGDTVVYFEIDTMLDIEDERFAFLAPRGARTDPRDDFTGHVLRTAKLRGELSQGLVLPVELFELELGGDYTVGRDVTEVLGLRKWDPPLAANLSGQAVGQRPSWVPKTDAERVQNLDLANLPREGWVASEKVDGTSTSFGIDGDGKRRVCTRQLELADAGQTQWQVAEQLELWDALDELADGTHVVLQGELAGPKIQGNPLKLAERKFFAFRLLVGGRDVPTADWPTSISALAAPVVDVPFPASHDEALSFADEFTSVVAPGKRPEGIVWRYEGEQVLRESERVVKAISNAYLLKQGS